MCTIRLALLTVLALLHLTTAGRAELVAHWKLDGDLTDAARDHDGSYNGGDAPFFVDGQDGTPEGSISLDGIDDFVQIPAAADLTLNSDFTLTLWVKFAVVGQAEKYLLSKHNGSQFAIIYGYTPDRVDFFAPGALGENPRDGGASELPLGDTEWHHIAYSRRGTTWSGYIDGIPVFSIERDFTLNSFEAPWFIGAARPDAVNAANAAIDDVRIYNTGLTDEDIDAIYNGDDDCPLDGDTHCTGMVVDGPADNEPGIYTVTASAVDDSGDEIIYIFTADNGLGTVLTAGPQASPSSEFSLTDGSWLISVRVDDDELCNDVAEDTECSEQVEVASIPALLSQWLFDGDLNDAVGLNDGFFFGDLAPVFVEGHDGTPEGAISFDGLDDFVEIPAAAELTLTGDFTFALWTKMEVLGQIEKYLLSKHGGGSQFAVIYGYVPDRVEFYAPGAIGWNPRDGGATEMPLDDTDWHHITYTRSGSTWSGYIDGIPVFSIERDFTLNAFDAPWYIGAARPDAANAVNAAIDDVRIYNYGLSEAEVLALVTDKPPPEGVAFIRGDANSDEQANISDASYILNFLFLGGPDLSCMLAGDANSDGTTNISDASYILNFLFLGGLDISPPNACDEEPLAEEEDCLSYPPCEDA